jgi:ABC-type transport system involved in multi-copper enzyme maturation permease subunit
VEVVTGDYRSYDREFKGRGYRIFRIFMNNFNTLISKWYTILVIVLSFVFLFFSIMGIVIGAMIEEEEVFTLQDFDEVYFEILPVSDEDMHVITTLNSTFTVRYNITNVGSNSTPPLLMFLPPNSLWNYSMDYPSGKLKPGDSMIVEIQITIPNNRSDFGKLDVSSYQKDEQYGDGGTIEKRQSFDDPGSIYIPTGDGEYNIPTNPHDFFGESEIYYSYFSRLTLLIVAPGDILDDVLEGNYLLNLDSRIASISTLVTLDKDDPGLFIDRIGGPPNMNFDTSFEMEIEDEEETPFRISMTSQDSEDIEVIVRNTGDRPIRVKLEALIMPIYDWDWFVEIYSERDHDDNPEGEILPGDEMRYHIIVSSGAYQMKMPYNIILMGTEISREEYQESRVTNMVVDITGAPETKDIKETFFQTFWGGEFNYERFLWFILLTAVCGGGIISSDLKNNTFTLYLSRPITWLDYGMGKFLALSGILSLITLVPVIIIFLVQMAFKDETFTYFIEHLWILGGMLLSYVIAIVIFSSLSLALSSLTKRGYYAGVGIFAYFIFTPPVADLMVGLFENDYLKVLNINLMLKNLFKPFYGLSYSSSEMGFGYHLLVLVAVFMIVFSWSILFLRFHKKEVAK